MLVAGISKEPSTSIFVLLHVTFVNAEPTEVPAKIVDEIKSLLAYCIVPSLFVAKTLFSPTSPPINTLASFVRSKLESRSSLSPSNQLLLDFPN